MNTLIDDTLDKMHCCGQMGTLNMEDESDKAQAKSELLKAILEVVGDDDKEVRGTTQNTENPMYWTKRTKARNDLRQELRTKFKQLFGEEKSNE